MSETPSAATLVLLSAFYGFTAVLIFRRLTNRARIRSAVNRILAHVMELGLFLDSPALVFRAQRDLLFANFHLLRLIVLPAGCLALVFGLAYSPMNAFFGHAPLPVGEPSVVTMQMKDAVMPPVQLQASPELRVETPEVRDLRDHEISWRVRPVRQNFAALRFHIGNRVVTASANAFFFRDPSIRSIDIRYPTIAIFGLPWLAWFFTTSTVSALAFGIWRK